MKKRIITGLLLFLCFAGFVALRFVHTLFFDAFVLIIMLGVTNEMISAYKICGKKPYSLLLYLYNIVIFLCYLFADDGKTSIMFQLIGLLIVFIICFVIELLTIHKEVKKVENIALNSSADLKDNSKLIQETLTTLNICIYPLLLLGTLYGINRLGLYTGFMAIIMVFGVASFSDMFAYFFGMLLGQNPQRSKLCPHISPKKSVIGFVFGCIGGIVVAGLGILFFYFEPIFETVVLNLSLGVNIALFATIGLLGTLVSQFGDLFSSAFKRKVGIKDFGSTFPGHGGFMDRVDSLMFVSSLVYLSLLCVM